MGITTQLKGNRAKSIGVFLASISNKMAFIIAIGGGLITALFTMLIPISVLETLTGASGLSEIIPATAAPLGSSAKTLFVILTAILASSIVLVLLLTLRREPEEDSIYADDDYIKEMAKERNRMALARDNLELAERNNHHNEAKPQNHHSNHNPNYDLDEKRNSSQKRDFADIAGGAITNGSKGLMAFSTLIKSKINALPFMGGDDSIRSFDDLPKLRGADKHPDAPARRPLSANEDLGESILDRGWDKKNTPQNAPDSKLSNNDQSLHQKMVHQDIHADNMPEYNAQYENQVEYREEVKIPDDIHLQPLHVERGLDQGRDYTEAHKVQESPVSIGLNNKYNVDGDENIEHVVADVPADSINDDPYELPTIDNLMDRLETLVERRAERVQARDTNEARENQEEPSEIIKEEPSEIIKMEQAAKKESQLDDYADVIDDVAIKRAEKLAVEKKQAIPSKDIINKVEQSKVTLVSDEVSETANKSDNDDTIVTKSQKADMDNALKSALETLHKMTERSA